MKQKLKQLTLWPDLQLMGPNDQETGGFLWFSEPSFEDEFKKGIMNQQKNKPLPCPWCGELPKVQYWHGGGPGKRMVSCYNNECHVAPQVCGPSLKTALKFWNIRAVYPDLHGIKAVFHE